MNMKITSYADLKIYLKSRPLNICWYGPRASDVSDLDDLLNITGVIACYGSDFNTNQPSLMNEIPAKRSKCSIDSLAGLLIDTGDVKGPYLVPTISGKTQ